MNGYPSAPSPMQRAKFNIDLEQLGVFLADVLIKRIDAFMPADRIAILKACRERLAAEGGDIAEHLLLTGSPQQHLPLSILPETLIRQLGVDQASSTNRS